MIRILDYQITKETDSILLFLKEHGYSSNLIVHLKKTPESILKNGIWSYVNEPLHVGDTLHIRIEENEGSDNIVPNEIPLSILYEDKDILVIDKPANMPIHPSINHYEQTLANGVLWYYTAQQIPYTFRCITRLDRDTTGVTLLAKHMLSASVLSKAMQQKQIQKEYLALCDGVTPEEGTIDAPICRAADSVIERCVDFENGDSAVTRFVRECDERTDFSGSSQTGNRTYPSDPGAHETYRASTSRRLFISSGKLLHEPPGIALCIPDFYTPDHRRKINHKCKTARRYATTFISVIKLRLR